MSDEERMALFDNRIISILTNSVIHSSCCWHPSGDQQCNLYVLQHTQIALLRSFCSKAGIEVQRFTLTNLFVELKPDTEEEIPHVHHQRHRRPHRQPAARRTRRGQDPQRPRRPPEGRLPRHRRQSRLPQRPQGAERR